MTPEEILERIAEILDRHGDGQIEISGQIDAVPTRATVDLEFPGLEPVNGRVQTMRLSLSIPEE